MRYSQPVRFTWPHQDTTSNLGDARVDDPYVQCDLEPPARPLTPTKSCANCCPKEGAIVPKQSDHGPEERNETDEKSRQGGIDLEKAKKRPCWCMVRSTPIKIEPWTSEQGGATILRKSARGRVHDFFQDILDWLPKYPMFKPPGRSNVDQPPDDGHRKALIAVHRATSRHVNRAMDVISGFIQTMSAEPTWER